MPKVVPKVSSEDYLKSGKYTNLINYLHHLYKLSDDAEFLYIIRGEDDWIV